MTGLRFDFEEHDLILSPTGSFVATEVSSQTCALIANSEICRITAADVGESLPLKLANRRHINVKREIASAVRAVERDGAKRVDITIDNTNKLHYYAEYGYGFD